jgi:hypothetical protein
VRSTSPAANATGVATTTTVTATFSEALDPNTINGTTFTLASPAGSVAASVSYNASTFVATLTPSATLNLGVTYTATILGGATGVKDVAGNALASTVTWSFTTANLLVGNNTIQTSSDNDKAGTAEAFLYTASAGGTATTLNLYVDSGSSATKVVVGIYSHNASTNAPASLLAQGTISAPTTGWNAVPLSSAVTIANGTKYWIAILSPSGSGTIKFRDKSSGGRSQVSSQATLTALPGTWSSGKSFTSSAMSAYASP